MYSSASKPYSAWCSPYSLHGDRKGGEVLHAGGGGGPGARKARRDAAGACGGGHQRQRLAVHPAACCEATCGRFPGTLDGCAAPHTATWPSAELLLHTSVTPSQQDRCDSVHFFYMAEVLLLRLMLLWTCARTLCAAPGMRPRGPVDITVLSGLDKISMPPPLMVHLPHRPQDAQAAGGGHGSAEAAHGQRRG